MNSEKDYVYEIETEVADLNEYNVLKPYGYQKLFAEVAEQHLSSVNANVDTTMKSNLAWALVSLSFELAKPIKGCVKMFAQTWYSQRRGPYFRREIVFKDEKGELIFQGSTFSILLDVEKRSIYRKKELPFAISEPIGEFTIEACPTFKTDMDFCKVDERKVYNSYIDCLGHVNNCRYGEFAYDVFTDEERIKLNKLKRMEFYFLSELRAKDTFSILKACDDNKILIRGHNDTKNDVSFDVIFEW